MRRARFSVLFIIFKNETKKEKNSIFLEVKFNQIYSKK
jgi:hypothetical protein